MNRTYSIVFNSKLGVWVVTSELSRRKKTCKTNTLCFLAILPLILFSRLTVAEDCTSVAYPTTGKGVFKCYVSGQLKNKSNDRKIDSHDSTSSASYKKKNQVFSNSTTFILADDIKWLPESSGPTTPLQVDYVKASRLFKMGALQILDKAGNVITELPKYVDWDINSKKGKVTVTINKTDGTIGYGDVYKPSEIRVMRDIDSGTNFAAQIITSQPTVPFVQLSLATIKNGADLNLISHGVKNKDGFAIDWEPGKVKQSSFFVTDGGNINLTENTSIRVTFAYTDGVNNPANKQVIEGRFGPVKELSGSTINFQGKGYLIDSLNGLDSYNRALITAVQNNTLTTADYEQWFHKAFKNGEQTLRYRYDPSKLNYNEFYISPEMQEHIGMRTIFEATNSGVINLKANVEAIGQRWARAFNSWIHDNGTLNNQGAITIRNGSTQNAIIESGGKYNNTGSLVFDVNGTNWADQVSGSGSTYKNEKNGYISIALSKENDQKSLHPNKYYKSNRNIATEVMKEALAVNNGKYFIGFKEHLGNSGTATGVHINNSGSFINNGTMNIGTDSMGNDIILRGGSPTEMLSIDNTNNAISGYANNDEKPINIKNNGQINIGKNSPSSVGINIGEDPYLVNAIGDGVRPKNVNVENIGTIKIAGKNSSGLRASGLFTQDNGNKIINTGNIDVSGAGSSGIFSTLGSEIINSGKISVEGNNRITDRAYGIRADNGTVTLSKDSALIVKGSNATGLYARTGGIINVNGGIIDTPLEKETSNQVVFWISGKNAKGDTSKIKFSAPTSYSLSNDNSTLFRVDQGASYDGSGSNLKSIDVNGVRSNGYIIAHRGTEFTSGKTKINVNGGGASGLNVNSGAGTDNRVMLNKDTKISVTGVGATIATVDGNNYDTMGNVVGKNGAKLISEAELTAGAKGQMAGNSIGYKIINSGELVHNGDINFSNATNVTGVYVNGGKLSNNGRVISNGIGIDVYQTKQDASIVNNKGNINAIDGIAAIRINDSASLMLEGRGVVTGGGAADAIRVMSGANLNTNSANVSVNGSGSGIHFLNTAGAIAGSTFKLSGSGNIDVSGNNASGIKLEGQNGSGPEQSNSNIDTRGSELLTINVRDRGGFGIVTNTSGYVYSGSSVNINSPFGQSALLAKGTTKDFIQTGNLISKSNSNSVVDLTQLSKTTSGISFKNRGNIIAKGNSSAIDVSNKKARIQNSDNGFIRGSVNLGDGDNEVILEDRSYATEVTAGNGNNLITVKNTAQLTGSINLGDGKNIVILKDNSRTKSINMGNGDNSVSIYGGTKNGAFASGSGNDLFTLIGVNIDDKNRVQSDDAFSFINGGRGVNSLNVTKKSRYILNDTAKIKNITNLTVEDHSTFEENGSTLNLIENGIIELDKSSTYFINYDFSKFDYNFDKSVRGEGTIRTNTNGKAFNLSHSDYFSKNFYGVLDLGNSKFSIVGDNAKSLIKSKLKLNDNGIGILNKNTHPQKIGGLQFSGGKLVVEENFIGSRENKLNSHLNVDDLDIIGKGTIHVTAGGFDNDYNKHHLLKESSLKSLLSQDDGHTLVTLVKASKRIMGEATYIKTKLTDLNGDVLPGSEDQLQDIRQKGDKVATGYYGIGSTTGKLGDGLYVSYLLKKIDTLKDKVVNLVSTPSDKFNSLKLSAQVSGSGGIMINSYGDSISLANGRNDYTGSTIVNYGELLLTDHNVLGQEDRHTDELSLLSNTTVKFRNTKQYSGKLNSKFGSTVALEQGTLSIFKGGNIEGNITSTAAAKLKISGGETDVTSVNMGYHGETIIADLASVNINNTAGLGDGKISLFGTLNMVGNEKGKLVNNLVGYGSANIVDMSDVELTGDNRSFSGSINIDTSSTLRASLPIHIGDKTESNEIVALANFPDINDLPKIHNNGNLWFNNSKSIDWTIKNQIDGKGDLHKGGTGALILSQPAAKYSGQTWVNEGTLVAGSSSSKVHMATSMLNISPGASFIGSGGIIGSVKNSGKFYVGELYKEKNDSPYFYNVNQDIANSGDIIVGNNNVTGNVLHIGGNYISRSGALYLNTKLNRGHKETDTDQLRVEGDIINMSGGTRIYITNIAGKGGFTQPDAIKIVDVKGTSDENAFYLGRPVVIGAYEYLLNKSNNNSWYLSSLNHVYPPSENRGERKLHYVNPMIGGFLSNQNALSMFNMTLHDRLGGAHYYNNLLLDGDLYHSIWLRASQENQRYSAVNNQLNISGKSTMLQLGHDIIHWTDGSDWRARIGIMGATGSQKMTSQSYRTGTNSFANINSAYSLGFYGTLYQHDKKQLGTYVDTWILYNWYRNIVGMNGYSDSKYNSHGSIISLEAGHAFILSGNDETENSWKMLPQAQLTFGNLTSSASKNDSGLSVNRSNSRAIESRLGTRFGYSYNLDKGRSINPFVEVNWRHDFYDNKIVFNEQSEFFNSRPKNRYEMKVGIEAMDVKGIEGWINISHSAGNNGYRDDKAMIGVKYNW